MTALVVVPEGTVILIRTVLVPWLPVLVKGGKLASVAMRHGVSGASLLEA